LLAFAAEGQVVGKRENPFFRSSQTMAAAEATLERLVILPGVKISHIKIVLEKQLEKTAYLSHVSEVRVSLCWESIIMKHIEINVFEMKLDRLTCAEMANC
jgi:hypothetical protein